MMSKRATAIIAESPQISVRMIRGFFPQSKQAFISRGIKRIWNHSVGVPSCQRILQYNQKATLSMETVYNNDGKIVLGLASRNGHRNEDNGHRKNRDGAQVKGSGEKRTRWLHQPAHGVRTEKGAAVLKKYNK